MEVVAADVRSHLHRVMDDDFTVNLNSNDKRAEAVSEDKSIRVNWKVSLPPRLQFRREEFKVGIISALLKNVQVNSPYSWIKAGGGNDIMARDIPAQHIETFADLFPYLLPMVPVGEPEMQLWIVMLHDYDKNFVYHDLTNALKAEYGKAINGSQSLDDIMGNITNTVYNRGAPLHACSYYKHRTTLEDDLKFLAKEGFANLRSVSQTYDLVWTLGPGDFGTGNAYDFRVGLVMSEDAAHFLRLTDEAMCKTYYNSSEFVTWGLYFGTEINSSDSKTYHYMGIGDSEYSMSFEDLLAPNNKPGIGSSWKSILPLRMSFKAGGTSDPDSSKKITISVESGKTLKFVSLDPTHKR